MFTFTDALILSAEAHRGIKDKGEVDYIKHPLHLAHKLKIKGYSNEHQITALLHDVIEDTETTFEDLEALHVPECVLIALRLLTHEVSEEWIEQYRKESGVEFCGGEYEYSASYYEAKGAEYLNYIEKLSKNDIARAVKLEDLKHNSDITRLHSLTSKDGDRLIKYGKARKILTPTVGY